MLTIMEENAVYEHFFSTSLNDSVSKFCMILTELSEFGEKLSGLSVVKALVKNAI